MKRILSGDVSRRLASLGQASELLVCSDFDGTLAPIAARPELARLLPCARELLHGLARLPQTRVAILSGRARDDLRAQAGLDHPVLLVGSHGAEFPGGIAGEVAGGSAADRQQQLDTLQAAMQRLCAASPGAWVERKPFGLAVHVREADPADAARVSAAVRTFLGETPGVKLMDGKAVIELSLARADKGDAIRWLREDMAGSPHVFYVGDDVTDEAAFAALGPADLGIKVGAGATAARHRVASEHAALAALALLWRRRSAWLAAGAALPRLRDSRA
mgnify:CR=1 FL=1